MRRYLRLATLLTSVTVLVFAHAGCGDGYSDDNDRPTVASTTAPGGSAPTVVSATPTATVATTPGVPGSTGIESADAAIAAVIAGDEDAVRALIVYTPTACEPQQEGIGAPPVCAEGEPEGTLVDVLPVAQCEGYFVRPADIEMIDIPTEDASLYAVYRRGPDTGFPPGDYVVVFARPAPNNNPGIWAWALTLTDDGVTGIHHGCAQTPESFVEFQKLTDAIIAPG